MSLGRGESGYSAIFSETSPTVSVVEVGTASLNAVSHHKYLRCATYVNPLVRQLSSGSTGNMVMKRNSIIVVSDAPVDKEEVIADVYEDKLESELEFSVKNDIDSDQEESDTSSYESDTDTLVESDEQELSSQEDEDLTEAGSNITNSRHCQSTADGVSETEDVWVIDDTVHKQYTSENVKIYAENIVCDTEINIDTVLQSQTGKVEELDDVTSNDSICAISNNSQTTSNMNNQCISESRSEQFSSVKIVVDKCDDIEQTTSDNIYLNSETQTEISTSNLMTNIPVMIVANDQEVHAYELNSPSKRDLGSPSEAELGSPSETELGSPAERELGSPSERELGSPSETELGSLSETELGSPLERELGSPSETELGSQSKRELASLSVIELGSPSETELGSQSERELGSPSERELGSPSERELGSPLERELGSPLETELGSPSEAELGSPSERELGSPAERELGSPSETELGSPSERELGSPLKRELGSLSETELGSPLKRELGSLSERELGSPLKRELGSLSETELGSPLERKLDLPVETRNKRNTLTNVHGKSDDVKTTSSKVTYKSTSFLVLSPTEPSVTFSGATREEPETRMSEVQAETQQETQSSQDEENAQKVNGTSNARENGLEEEEVERDPDIFRETRDKEEVHFTEMSNVRQKFESGGTRNDEPAPRAVSVRDEYDAGGEFENQPVINPDVVRESDRPSEELPEVGTARNLADRFKNISEEKSKPVASGKRVSPPRATEKVEYESQPTEHIEQYQGQSEAGEFESQPNVQSDVVRSGDKGEDYTPEKGSAKNIMNRFKEQQTESSQYKLHEKREMTPDRSGKVEFVSEPRGQSIQYTEAQSESGVYENVPKVEEDVVRSGDKAEEPLPEQGMAKNLLSKFKQLETEAGNKPPPSPQRAVSQERKGKVEARGYLERYEPTVESGEYENKPESRPDVIKSGEAPQEVLPEVGMAKKTLERFKEIQKQSTSPVSAKSKEFTPPRESSPGRTVAGVVENTPESHPDVVRSGDLVQDDLPEQGSAKNILNKFKEIQSSSSQSSSPGRKQKEFTPPPEAGVYENTPQKHLEIETRQSESGIIENTPAKSTADNARERECVTPESELPEQGMAKNLVSKWKQIETTSAKSTASASPRFKEFTPPRETRGPMSPKSPAGTVTNGVHPNELPGQYQPQTAPTTYENDPQRNADVYREVDTDWEAGMPAPNTTASMLSRFKEIQQKAAEDSQTPAPVTRKESSPPREDPEPKNIQYE
ncbi:serine/arginine repetitive matrix protein 2-like isoform X6 [Mya arenaria]|uniref:serine/arginine repetitive matrix protein 2-like isoform X6 n=1 Tax=Mya arenaria TaxID=6604 RepID=UPI0022E4E0AB|nr:serine/arginine repetitive matrix protein 2-like isoform X6 [Mya arenaria]